MIDSIYPQSKVNQACTIGKWVVRNLIESDRDFAHNALPALAFETFSHGIRNLLAKYA